MADEEERQRRREERRRKRQQEEAEGGEEEAAEEPEEEEEAQEEEPRTPVKKMAPPEDTGPSEAELAMQRRRQPQISSAGLDAEAQQMLEDNRVEREKMEAEIQELRERSERRKKEREEEERRMSEQRAQDEAKRKADEEERRRVKEEQEAQRREERAQKLAEAEKWKNPPKRNFVITKKSGGGELTSVTPGRDDVQKSKEQQEAERKAILAQRIQPLNTDGFDQEKYLEKARELHQMLLRLESEKYDLEQRFKRQQYDMVELAERARQMNKGGKGKKAEVQRDQVEVDKIQERFAGAPPKIQLCSKYERRKDKRAYGERRTVFTGPQYLYPADKIKATKNIIWGEAGPEYEDIPGAEEAQE